MTLSSLISTTLKAVSVSLLTSLAAHAAYFTWEMVELPASSGASCGNGTPYRFFVNRTPFTTKTAVMFEGGGACWEQGSCKGGGLLDAVNPDGIPANYMSDWNRQAHWGIVTPFTARVHPLQAVQTQSWNIVYLTYCTGDVHTGNKVAVYKDQDPSQPTTVHHRGAVNAKAVARWMAANKMNQPAQLFITGFSAGGAGSTSLYPFFRETLKPKKMGLLADSGPLFDAPRTATPAQAPSVLLHNKIREAWGLDGPQGLVTELIAKYPTAGDANNLGSVTNGLGKIFPQDRFGYSLFQEDAVYSAFSYEKFYPEIANAPTDAQRRALLNVKWRQEISPWLAGMTTSNTGYYVPNKRDIQDSHCATIVTFGGTSIAERNLRSVGTFVDNIIDGKGPVMRAYEHNPTSQRVYLSDMFADLIAPLIP